MIIELRPEMVGKANPLGLATSIIELLAMLKREHGAAKVETLWPVGVSVLQGFGGPLARLLLPKLLKKLPANARLAVEELLAAPALGGIVDPELAAEARLRLRITLPPGEDVAAVLKKVVANAGVEYAEPVPYMWGSPIGVRTRDEMLAEFPHSKSVGNLGDGSGFPVREEGYYPLATIGRPPSWDELSLSNIAVLDSGCDEKHPGLAGAVDYPNKESRRDGYGHGTFVAHTIVGRPAEATKKLGLDPNKVSDTPAGLLPKAKVWAANVMDPVPFEEEGERPQYSLDPGRFSRELNRLARRATKRMKEIDVVNLSLGSVFASQTLKSDMKALSKAGIVAVAAAGNSPEGEDTEAVIYPAAFGHSISVGALAFAGSRKGVWARTNDWVPDDETERVDAWDVCAPGEWILSGLPMNENALGLNFSGWLSGTSMAAPYVTAAVAVLCSRGIKDRDEILAALQEIGDYEESFTRLKCPAAR